MWTSKRATRFIAKPWYDLRAELGLPRAKGGGMHIAEAIRREDGTAAACDALDRLL